jgi:hypothetical protein
MSPTSNIDWAGGYVLFDQHADQSLGKFDVVTQRCKNLKPIAHRVGFYLTEAVLNLDAGGDGITTTSPGSRADRVRPNALGCGIALAQIWRRLFSTLHATL